METTLELLRGGIKRIGKGENYVYNLTYLHTQANATAHARICCSVNLKKIFLVKYSTDIFVWPYCVSMVII